MSTNERYHFFEKEINGKSDEIYDYAPKFDSTGDFQRIKGIDVAIYAIRNLLLTPLGHYPFDPEYGSLLYKKIFEMADSVSRHEIEYECKTRIRQYEKRVKIKKVDVGYGYDRKTVIVNIHIERDGVEGDISLSFDDNNRMFGLEDDITAGLI